jgi:hypothetical protein
MMKRIAFGVAAFLAFDGHAWAANAVNKDTETQIIVVTENGGRSELEIEAGASAEFCQNGCFVTFPNGDREALTGSETVEISGGAGHVK